MLGGSDFAIGENVSFVDINTKILVIDCREYGGLGLQIKRGKGMEKKVKMAQFQGLRTAAFLAIFISHANIGPFGAMGAWGVSVFFCVSGFLMAYNYLPREEKPEFGLGFVWNKIKKLYPLHIATMLGMVLYYVLVFHTPAKELLISAVLHTALIQIWVPLAKYYVTLNGVAWYLCACAFCYLCFPLVLKILHRCSSRKVVVFWICGLFLVVLLIAIVSMRFGSANKNELFSMQWITYYFPPSRFVEFVIGCCLGYLFSTRNVVTLSTARSSLFEVTAWVGAMLATVVCASKRSVLGTEYIRYTLLFLPSTIAIVWLTAENGGAVSLLLQNKILVWVGNLSPYAFLIHPLAIKFCHLLAPKLSRYILAILALILTVTASYVWMRLEQKYYIKKHGNERARKLTNNI